MRVCYDLFNVLVLTLAVYFKISFTHSSFHFTVIQQFVNFCKIIICCQSLEHTKHKMQGKYFVSLKKLFTV